MFSYFGAEALASGLGRELRFPVDADTRARHFFCRMTTEDIFYNELLARKARLEGQIKESKAQLSAVNTMLAAVARGRDADAPEVPSAPPPAAAPPALRAETPPPPAALAPPVPVPEPAAPVAPAEPPVPDTFLSARDRKRGWLMHRIEQLIDEGPPSFSLVTIFEAYRVRWGWNRYPTKSAIGATIWKIVRKRRHTVLHRGSGRRSSTYQRAATARPSA